MGMCKKCNQIFNTEEMKNGFCKECQKTDDFLADLIYEKSGHKEKDKLKDKKFFYTVIFAILIPIDIYLIYQENYHLVFIISVLPLFGVFSYLEDVYYNNKKINTYKNNENNELALTNKKEIFIKSLIVLSVLWLLFLFPAPTYAIKKYISFGVIPVALLLGLIWIYLAYSKNKK